MCILLNFGVDLGLDLRWMFGELVLGGFVGWYWLTGLVGLQVFYVSGDLCLCLCDLPCVYDGVCLVCVIWCLGLDCVLWVW